MSEVVRERLCDSDMMIVRYHPETPRLVISFYKGGATLLKSIERRDALAVKVWNEIKDAIRSNQQ